MKFFGMVWNRKEKVNESSTSNYVNLLSTYLVLLGFIVTKPTSGRVDSDIWDCVMLWWIAVRINGLVHYDSQPLQWILIETKLQSKGFKKFLGSSRAS